MKISVITVCYNAEKDIAGAIESVLSQTHSDIEYIIVDGQSTDKTLEIIRRYQNRITKVISEKDAGIYDAMNKGVKLSTGEVLYFLNADDRLYDARVVADIAEEFRKDERLGLLYGKVKGVNAPAETFLNPLNYEGEIRKKWDLIVNGICHQRIFCRKQIFENIGLFDKKFKVFADFDWILKAYNRSVKFGFIDRFFAVYNCQGTSFLKRYKVIAEKIQVTYQNTSWMEFLCYAVYATIRKAKDIVLEKSMNLPRWVLQNVYRIAPFDLRGDLKVDSSQTRKSILSCLICASNRPEELNLLFSDLANQTLRKDQFEVVLILDGSSVTVMALVKKYTELLDIKYKHYDSPQKIIGRLRNESISLSQGQYILFLDDDTRLLQKNFLERALEIFSKENPDVIMPLGHPIRGLVQEEYCFLDDYSFANRCCLYQYDILKKIGAFKDSLKAYEDIEMSIRLTISGIHVLKTDLLEYFHPPLYFSSMDKPLAIGQTIWHMKKDYSFPVWAMVYLNALRFLWYGLIPTPRHQQWFKISLGVLTAPFYPAKYY